MEQKLRKLIIGFFIVMLGLTFLSRAAASVMVPKAKTATAQEGSLTYKITGSGIIKENAKKYIELMNGYKISQIGAKEGQTVEKGEVLFSYDLDQMKEKESALVKELKKLQLQYEKTQLGRKDSDSLKSENKTEEAQENKQLAEEEEKRAAEDKKRAKESLEKTKKNLITAKQEEYEKAASDYDDQLSAEEDDLISAQRKVDDARKALENLLKPKVKLQETLTNYRTAVEGNKEEAVSKAYFSIFDLYYDGTYQEHLRAVEKKKEELRRANEDLKDISMGWIDGKDWDTIEKEKRIAGRTVSDLQKDLDILTKEDTELEKAVDVYRRSILRTENWNVEDAENLLYAIIYKKMKLDEDKINDAQTSVTRAEEDQEQVKAQWDKKEREVLEKKNKLYSELTAMQQDNYDWQEALASSENALRSADETLNKSEAAVKKADRELEAVELDLQESSENLAESNQAVELELKAITLDMEDKQSEIDKVKKLIAKRGKVTSPVSGVVLSATLEPGVILSGQESLVISTGGYELLMKGTKEELKNFSAGDEVSIKTEEEYNKITANIENIELPDQDGNISFTALLPEDRSYRVGGSLEFELQKNSKNYSACIPIQAIREDTSSKFVLLIRETNGILGKVETAFRLDVTITAQDEKSAAVEAALSREDEIIVSSSKNISEGDRVRVVKTE